MVTGNFSIDELTGLFRALSQKRKHGLLTVFATNGAELEVLFVSGRIAEVRERGWPNSLMVCDRLISGGVLLPPGVREKASQDGLSIKALFDELVEAGVVTFDQFMAARRAVCLDMLHSLRFLEDGRYNFEGRLVDFDERLTLKLSPGQLLLDFVEMDANEDKFFDVFGDDFDQTNSTFVIPTGSTAPLNDAEKCVWDVVGGGEQLRSIVSRTLLSEGELQMSLLSLYEQGLIEVRKADILSSSGENQGAKHDTSAGVSPVLKAQDSPEEGDQPEADELGAEIVQSPEREEAALPNTLHQLGVPQITAPGDFESKGPPTFSDILLGLNYWSLSPLVRKGSIGVVALLFLLITGMTVPRAYEELFILLEKVLSKG